MLDADEAEQNCDRLSDRVAAVDARVMAAEVHDMLSVSVVLVQMAVLTQYLLCVLQIREENYENCITLDMCFRIEYFNTNRIAAVTNELRPIHPSQ